MGGRDYSCEYCGRGGLNDPDGKCICIGEERTWRVNSYSPANRRPSGIWRVELWGPQPENNEELMSVSDLEALRAKYEEEIARLKESAKLAIDEEARLRAVEVRRATKAEAEIEKLREEIESHEVDLGRTLEAERAVGERRACESLAKEFDRRSAAAEAKTRDPEFSTVFDANSATYRANAQAAALCRERIQGEEQG